MCKEVEGVKKEAYERRNDIKADELDWVVWVTAEWVTERVCAYVFLEVQLEGA